MEAFYITTQAVVAVVCWLVTAAGATIAVLSPRINDTLLERIGLSGIAIGAIGTACRIVKQGWISEGATFMAIALAFYVGAIFYKHAHRGNVWPLSKR